MKESAGRSLFGFEGTRTVIIAPLHGVGNVRAGHGEMCAERLAGMCVGRGRRMYVEQQPRVGYANLLEQTVQHG